MEATPRVRASLAEVILEYLDRVTSGSRASISASSAVGLGDATDPRRILDVGVFARLLEQAARTLDDPAIGLHLAADFELGTLGPFSYAILNAPTLGTALRNVERFSGSLAVGGRPRLVTDGRTASLMLPRWGPDPIDVRQLAESAGLIFLRMLRRLAGPGWAPIDVDFRHPAPTDLRTHRELMRTTMHFGRSADRIRFPSADLERAVPGADRFLLPIVERQLQEIVSDEATRDPFRQEIELLVASRVCDGHPNIAALAPHLGLSVRTLQRRLRERGLSYKHLVADVRMQIARRYLAETEPGLGEIAFLLGYSELSAFDRAFRGWSGVSPGEYRRQQHRETLSPSPAARAALSPSPRRRRP